MIFANFDLQYLFKYWRYGPNFFRTDQILFGDDFIRIADRTKLFPSKKVKKRSFFMKKWWKIMVFSENLTFWKIITGFCNFFWAQLFTEWLDMIVRWCVSIFRIISSLVATKSQKSWKKHEKLWYFGGGNHDYSW